MYIRFLKNLDRDISLVNIDLLIKASKEAIKYEKDYPYFYKHNDEIFVEKIRSEIQLRIK